MKSKAPLAMIEQMIMLLVFALAAAICLKAFVWADQTSKYNEARDSAVLLAESAAELLKESEGDMSRLAEELGGTADEDSWTACYDENWQLCDRDQAACLLEAALEPETENLLGSARITASKADGSVLTQLTAAWQKEADR